MKNEKHFKVKIEGLKSKYIKIKNKIKNIDFIRKTNSKKNTKKSKISIKEKFNFKELSKNKLHMKLALSGMMILLIAGLGVRAVKIDKIKNEAFNVYWGQEVIATVREEKEALDILNNLKDELSKTYDMDVALKDEIAFEKTYAKDKNLTSERELKDEIKSNIDYKVIGFRLKVDGVEIGALKTKEELEDILARIKEPYENLEEEGKILKQVKFVENIEIEKEEMQVGDITDSEDIYEKLLTSSEEIRTHTIEVGESFWTVAMFYNMEVEDLVDANPDKNPEALQIGDEIKLVIPKPLVTVATVSEIAYTDELKYETEVEYDDDMYNIHSKTKKEGSRGLARYLAEEIRYNGYYMEQKIIKEEILEAPINEIVVKGTKEPPKTMATGALMMPTRGRLSSGYGMRSGRMHRGIDIASSVGTDIKAADGGKVVYTGYKGAYGNLVEIDHENGYKTRYAHNSKILVKAGDRVYKGQVIAKMGSTGRSTGSHLHFEVLVNGSNKNPSNYVK